MNFLGCLVSCARSPQLIAEFTRRTGRDIGEKLSPDPVERLANQLLEVESDDDLSAFVVFCKKVVWDRIGGRQSADA